MCTHSNRRSPRTCAARGVHLHVSETLQSVAELAEGPVREQVVREHLAAAVRVTRKLEAHPGVFGQRQSSGNVIEENARWAVLQPKPLEKSPHVQRGGSLSIRHSQNPQTIHRDTFVVQYANADFLHRLFKASRSSEFFVISTDEEDAERGIHISQRRDHLRGINFAAVEKIACEKNDRRIQFPRFCCNPSRKGSSVHVP